jgi:hypothetical protein
MSWHIVDKESDSGCCKPIGIELTDNEVIKIYNSVYASNRDLARKFKPIVDRAVQRSEIIRWEGEGGKPDSQAS